MNPLRPSASQSDAVGEPLLRVAVESSPSGMIMVDARGRILLVNSEIERMFGYSREELLGQSVELLVPVQSRDVHREFRGTFRTHPASRAVAGRELHGLHKTGRPIPAEIGLRTIDTESGRFVLASVVDISQRRHAEEALHTSERRARTLFETVHLIVLGLDATGHVDYVNPFFLEISGFAHEEVVGADWINRFVPPEDRVDASSALLELLELGLHTHHESTILTRAGDRRRIAWSNTVLRDIAGRATGTLSIGQDVTEQQKLEEQFRQAQKMEAVGRLAGGVAHDFNNLLTVISAFTELVAESLPDEDARQADLGEIRTAVGSATALTRQLLAFSRRQVVSPKRILLEDAATRAANMLQRVIGEDIQLALTLSHDHSTVVIDPGQLDQLIMNLAVNARDAMPEGGTLTIATEQVAAGAHPENADLPPGAYALLTIADTGAGMDDPTMAHIFEPFFTTKGPGVGTGLGLATVDSIVKQCGGHIRVASEPGRGATFRIYLPLASEGAEAHVPEGAAGATHGTETVLVTEDSAAVRALTSRILIEYGYEVLEAPDAEAALTIGAAHRGRIHLLITDVVMPGGSGHQLAEQFLRVQPDAKILYVSGYTDDAILKHGVLEGEVAYLPKPFTGIVLARKVRETLDARR